MGWPRKLLCCVLLLHLACAWSFVVDRTVPIACSGQFDLGNSALYNLAFDWTKHSTLEGWTYTDSGRDDMGRECALVSYSTQIRVHRLFESVLPSRVLKAKIDKRACAHGDALEETVAVSELLLIDRMQISIRFEIDRITRTLRMLARSDFNVPWFLHVFEKSIVREIEQSVAEYHELLVGAVCSNHAR